MNRFCSVLLASASMMAFANAAEAQTAESATGTQAGPRGTTATTQAANANTNDQGEIVVTAQKREQRLLDVPQSVSVVSSKQLENAHAERLQDYFNRVPSAQVVESQPGFARVTLRGINTGGVGATVATYIDETPYGSATSLANGGVTAPDLDPFDLARVEVLRGPQGTLYGANSLGGLVKYVTLLPDLGAFEARGQLGYETVAHGESAASVRAGVNVPLGDIAAARVTGYWRKEPGWIDNPHLGDNINDGKVYGGRASLLARPSGPLQFRASALVQDIKSGGNSTIDVDPVTLQPAHGRYEQFKLFRELADMKYRVYNATATYDFGSANLLSSTSFGRLKYHQFVDYSGIYGPALSAGLGTPLGAAVDSHLGHRRFTEEVRLSSSGRRRLDWVAGVFYTNEHDRLAQDLFAIDAVTGDRVAGLDGVITVDFPTSYHEIAGFANATLHVSDHFDLTAGGRYSHNKQEAVQTTNGLLVGGVPTIYPGSSSEGVFTYAVAPAFKPTRYTTIYARVAKGYRPGGPNAVSPTASAAVPRQFGSDTTLNYEAGIKSEVIPRVLTLEATAFQMDWTNIQLLVQVEGIGINSNGGKARSRGLEFSATANPLAGLSVNASLAYVNAKLRSDTDPLFVGAVTGDPLPFSPRWSGALAADYEHQMGTGLTSFVGASMRYTGKRSSGFDPHIGQKQLGDYVTIDAHAGVGFDRFRVDAFVRNLTDARGVLDLGPAGSGFNGTLTEGITRPRTFGVTLGYRY